MPLIRTRQDIDDLLGGPTPAEVKLMKASTEGNPCQLNEYFPTRQNQSDSTTVRSDVLRYLILGGCSLCKVADKGVQLIGGHVIGKLDLSFATATGATRLTYCLFDETILAIQAKFQELSLNHSDIVGLSAWGMEVKGSVLLRGLKSTEAVAINSSNIGGQVSAGGARLRAETGFALNVHSSVIDGGLFLQTNSPSGQRQDDEKFVARGGVKVTASTIGMLYMEGAKLVANLDPLKKTDKDEKQEFVALSANNLTVLGDIKLGEATFEGEVKLSGARIEGILDCEKTSFENEHGHAFNGQRMRVGQSFKWRKGTTAQGGVSLNGAHVGELYDDLGDWPGAGELYLDGFTYDRINGKVSTSKERRNWLKYGSLNKGQFFPQPYTQYATFLQNTGHDEQARRVLLQREREVRKHERQELSPLHCAWRYLWDGLQLVVVGHGHQPFWSIGWLLFLIFLATFPANRTWKEGSFAPNSAPVLVSYYWKKYERTEEKPALVWSGEQPPKGWKKTDQAIEWKDMAPGRDWETFNRYAYAADIVIPIIDFGQTDAWAPSTTRQEAGQRFWWTRWIFTVLGWIVTALGAAAITGIIRRD